MSSVAVRKTGRFCNGRFSYKTARDSTFESNENYWFMKIYVSISDSNFYQGVFSKIYVPKGEEHNK